MRMLAGRSFRVGVCLLAMMSAARAAPDPVAPRPNELSDSSAPKVSVPSSIWDISPDGTATHLQSGMSCPHSSGDFINVGERVYDRAGFDISCGYTSPRSGVITLYLTLHDPARFQTDFEDAKKAIVSHTPSARPRDGVIKLPARLDWKSAGYEERDGALNSDVAMTLLSGWEYEIRATYRPMEQPAIETAIENLTATILDSAGKHLAACAASPPPQRSGARITDQKQLMTYSVMASVELSISPRENIAPVWCAESAFGVGDRPFVFWRNIAQSDAGPADRISPVAEGRSITILFDALATAAADKENPDTHHAIYEIVLENDKEIVVVGISDGRLSSQQVAAFTLTQPSIPVLVRIDKHDRKITVFAPKP
jgi:hypothetical protein